jgi:hypothetical protein
MAYIYESIQSGIFNFTIPGKDKNIQLFRGDKVTVDQKLTGGYLRVLKLVGETEDTPNEIKKTVTTKPKAKVEDKITEVKEVIETPTEEVEIKAEDTISEVTETIEAVVKEETPAPKRRGKRK